MLRELLRCMRSYLRLLTAKGMAGILVAFATVCTYVHVAEFASLVPFRFGEAVRYFFYKWTLASCGDDVTINFGTILSYRDITVGNHVWIGTYNIIGHAALRDHTLTAQGCHIVSGANQHGFQTMNIPIMYQEGDGHHVELGPDVWLGAGTIIMANVGKGCVIGAGSVVTKDIPDYSVAVGNPARVIKSRLQTNDQML